MGVGLIKKVRYTAANGENVLETRDLVDKRLLSSTEGWDFRGRDVQWNKQE